MVRYNNDGTHDDTRGVSIYYPIEQSGGRRGELPADVAEYSSNWRFFLSSFLFFSAKNVDYLCVSLYTTV